MKKKRILLMITDGGGCHRTAALAIKKIIETAHDFIDCDIVNPYKEILGKSPYLPIRIVGRTVDNLYNYIALKKNLGRFFVNPFMVFITQNLLKKQNGRLIKLLLRYWQKKKPDVIISLMPLFNGIMCKSLREYNSQLPFITVITDFDEWMPKVWLEEKNQFIVCYTEKTKQQADTFGIPNKNIHLVSGLVVHPKFYHPATKTKVEIKKSLDLDPQLPLGIAIFGGYGNKEMYTLLKTLSNETTFQILLICGKNVTLLKKLSRLPTKIRKVTMGFVSDLNIYMNAADFFIGKPGAGCINEAIVCSLPIIVAHNKATMMQEKYIASWIIENQIGLSYRNPKEIKSAISNLLKDYSKFKQNVDQMKNKAAFEILPIINQIMENKCQTGANSNFTH